MQDRRSGQERRLEDLPVEIDRREGERRESEQSRRQVMDRRVQSQPVENDRRKGVRRNAEAKAAEEGKEVAPDWMEEVLAEAAKREEGSPSMSPPPVNEKENQYLDMPYEERMKQARFHDYLIMGFVLICFIFLTLILVYGV